MTNFKDLTIEHDLVRLGYNYIKDHNGYALTSVDIAKAVGVPVSSMSRKSMIGIKILSLLIEHGYVTMKESDYGVRKYKIKRELA